MRIMLGPNGGILLTPSGRIASDPNCCCGGQVITCCFNAASGVSGTTPFGAAAMTKVGSNWVSSGDYAPCAKDNGSGGMDTPTWQLEVFCDADGKPQMNFSIGSDWQYGQYWQSSQTFPPQNPGLPITAVLESQSLDGLTTTWRMNFVDGFDGFATQCSDYGDCAGPPGFGNTDCRICACIQALFGSSFTITVVCTP